jgi:ubiquinone/menaquinone biosynthesis C-methylase UbiE
VYSSAKFWDKVADKYAAAPIRNPSAYEATLDQVRALASSDHRVLELGCGTGTTAVALAASVSRIVATDVSAAMLDKGREKAAQQGITHIEFATADPWDAPRGPFDMVLAFNLLHLLKDMPGALSEIAKRTKPGGVFVSKTFCMPGPRNMIWWVVQLGLPVMQAIGKAPYFAKLSADDLRAAISEAGFVIETMERAPGKDPRWTVIARRVT